MGVKKQVPSVPIDADVFSYCNFFLPGKLVKGLGRDRWNFGEDRVYIHILAAFGALPEVSLGIYGGELLRKRAANQLIDGNPLVTGQTFRVLMNGMGKSNA